MYISGNIGVIIWAGQFAIQQATVLRAIFIFVFSIIFMNLLIWLVFKMRETADKKETKGA